MNLRVLLLISFMACNQRTGEVSTKIVSAPPEKASAAITNETTLRFYLGQPGMQADLVKIDAAAAGQLSATPPYKWWRLTIPASGDSMIDLSVPNPNVEYQEFFTVAPGCGQENSPWVGAWRAGDPGVSGYIKVRGGDPFHVEYSFDFRGTQTMPCGARTGHHSSSNVFAAEAPTP